MAERGGPNGGPQYSPMNVSGTGGAGQSGTQAKTYIPGMRSQGVTSKEVMDQQGGADMYKAPDAEAVATVKPDFGIKMGALLEESQDSLPITDGVNVGPGRGEQVLPPQFRTNARRLENVEVVKKYLPIILMGAQIPDAPDSYKQFAGFLQEQVWE